MRRALGFPILATLLGTACATPGHVRRVETRVAMMEQENARADSARAADLKAIQTQIRQLSDRFALFADNASLSLDSLKRNDRGFAGDILDINRQLLALGERMGQTQSIQRALTSKIDEMTEQQVARSTDTSMTVGAQSEEQLLTQAKTSTSQRAYATARSTYWEMLRAYPTSPRASEALLGIGLTFVDPAESDSARFYFSRVTTEFPRSEEAPRALFKLGDLALRAGDKTAARRFLKRVVDEYPASLEAKLADEKLKGIP